MRIAPLVMLAVLAGCRQFDAPLAPNTGTASCHADAECGSGICNAGQCDTTHCHLDAQCASQFCFGNQDGGAPGTCGTRSCFGNADCALGFRCTQSSNTISCTPGCEVDLDCPSGEACVTAGLASGICYPGCRTSADCDGGFCDRTSDGGYPFCAFSSRCNSDADCPSCGTCNNGVCVTPANVVDGGLPILGTPSAVHMSDLLQPTVDGVAAALPDAWLSSIDGYGMHQDGTIDLTNPQDYISRWNFTFDLSDGGSLQVIYGPSYGRCATYTFNNYALAAEAIAPSVLPSLVDPATWETQFTANASCDPWVGNPADTFSIMASGDGGGQASVFNRNSDFLTGDAVTGQVIYESCQ